MVQNKGLFRSKMCRQSKILPSMDSIHKPKHPNRNGIALREVQFYNNTALPEVQSGHIVLPRLCFPFPKKQFEGTPIGCTLKQRL